MGFQRHSGLATTCGLLRKHHVRHGGFHGVLGFAGYHIVISFFLHQFNFEYRDVSAIFCYSGRVVNFFRNHTVGVQKFCTGWQGYTAVVILPVSTAFAACCPSTNVIT